MREATLQKLVDHHLSQLCSIPQTPLSLCTTYPMSSTKQRILLYLITNSATLITSVIVLNSLRMYFANANLKLIQIQNWKMC